MLGKSIVRPCLKSSKKSMTLLDNPENGCKVIECFATQNRHGIMGTISGRGDGNPDAHVAQLVERILGKDEVIGSNPIVGST